MIHTIDLHFQTSHSIASYVIDTTVGPVMVETGPHSAYKNLVAGLESIGYQPGDIKHVFLSHIHFDHAGAAWALAKAGATVYVHPRGWKHLLNPERLYNSARMIYGDQMETLWGLMENIPESQLISVEDGQSFTVGDKTFAAWHTPGHASHHIAWQLEDAVFTGDVGGARINNGPNLPPCPPPDIDIEAWDHSIDRILALKPKRLFLTHFGEATDIEPHFAELRQVLHDWAHWIKPHYEAGKSAEELIPGFQEFAAKPLYDAGLNKQEIKEYFTANPPWMSVAGLLRYWKKKEERG
ncbi:MAG: MBL fold metallo-hydrolase [Bacteroidota bacterium]